MAAAQVLSVHDAPSMSRSVALSSATYHIRLVCYQSLILPAAVHRRRTADDMAYVLPLAEHSPFAIGSRNDTTVRSSCSAASIRSGGTVQRHQIRSVSTDSFSSIGSHSSQPLRRQATPSTESTKTPTAQSTSAINLGLSNICQKRRSGSQHTTLASSTLGKRWRSQSLFDAESAPLRLVDVAEGDHARIATNMSSSKHSLDTPLPDSDSSGACSEDARSVLCMETLKTVAVEAAVPSSPSSTGRRSQHGPIFSRWVNKLRKQRHPSPPCVSEREERWTLDDFDPAPLPSRSKSPRKGRHVPGHHKSDSQESSLRFITSMRSATATVASTSIATLSRRTTKWRRGQQRSSIVSGSDPRPSVDSVRSVIDEAAKQRSRKRRQKLEEMIRTEESYVADIKALSDV